MKSDEHSCMETIDTGQTCIVDGIQCKIIKRRFRAEKGRYHIAYRFTVPGWPECEIVGMKATRRVIRGRTDPLTRRIRGID